MLPWEMQYQIPLEKGGNEAESFSILDKLYTHWAVWQKRGYTSTSTLSLPFHLPRCLLAGNSIRSLWSSHPVCGQERLSAYKRLIILLEGPWIKLIPQRFSRNINAHGVKSGWMIKGGEIKGGNKQQPFTMEEVSQGSIRGTSVEGYNVRWTR